MSSEVLSYFLKNKDLYVQTGFQIALQCAPLLKGLKVSCIISMEKKRYCFLEQLLKGTEIEFRILAGWNEKALVLLFRRKVLQRHLDSGSSREILAEYGYAGLSLDEMLEKLEDRMEIMEKRNRAFPHEIGVFLGYPAEDVKGFIQNRGKEYLLLGYWKVYSNPQNARMIFKSYDRAKEQSVREFTDGKTIREIVGLKNRRKQA